MKGLLVLTGLILIIATTYYHHGTTRDWQIPLVLREQHPLPDETTSLDALASPTWSQVHSSKVHAKGKARLPNGTLVMDPTDWRGLVSNERLMDSVKFVQANADESKTTFGSLSAILFQGENELINALGLTSEFLHSLSLPIRFTPFDAYTLWIRASTKQSTYNPVDWHAHPDAGIYLHLFGRKSFHFITTEEWKRYLATTVEWDSHFPLCFGSGTDIARLQRVGKITVQRIDLQPGMIIYQPPWVMHRLSYDDAMGEFASLRFGFLPLFAISSEPWMFLRTIPLYLDVGWKMFWQWVVSATRNNDNNT